MIDLNNYNYYIEIKALTETTDSGNTYGAVTTSYSTLWEGYGKKYEEKITSKDSDNIPFLTYQSTLEIRYLDNVKEGDIVIIDSSEKYEILFVRKIERRKKLLLQLKKIK